MKAVRGTLTMNRGGDFRVKTYGNHHCGRLELLDIKYHVIVECGVTSLDHRGFLFDQFTVDKFFQNIKVTKLSCEQFAIQCARRLWRSIHNENPGCLVKEMKLTLTPAPFAASMTFHYSLDRDGKAKKKVRS